MYKSDISNKRYTGCHKKHDKWGTEAHWKVRIAMTPNMMDINFDPFSSFRYDKKFIRKHISCKDHISFRG